METREHQLGVLLSTERGKGGASRPVHGKAHVGTCAAIQASDLLNLRGRHMQSGASSGAFTKNMLLLSAGMVWTPSHFLSTLMSRSSQQIFDAPLFYTTKPKQDAASSHADVHSACEFGSSNRECPKPGAEETPHNSGRSLCRITVTPLSQICGLL